jgi:hypothetical protein
LYTPRLVLDNSDGSRGKSSVMGVDHDESRSEIVVVAVIIDVCIVYGVWYMYKEVKREREIEKCEGKWG